MMKSIVLTYLMVSFSIFLIFQNCADVGLQQTVETQFSSSSVNGKICLPEGMALENLVLTNLNYRLLQGKFVADSDSDGLSDEQEIDLGFDPFQRRSSSGILDSVCFKASGANNCESFAMDCSAEELEEDASGFSICDYKSLNLLGGDTDEDGLVDSLEILFNTLPLEKDKSLDYDYDGMVNLEEIKRGSDPKFADAQISLENRLPIYGLQKLDNPDCAGEYWELSLDKVIITFVPEYTENDDFAHKQDENIYMVWATVKPIGENTGNSELRIINKKLSKDMEWNFEWRDFKRVGKW